jgi:hypothetical protein
MVSDQHGHGAVRFAAGYGDQPSAHFRLKGKNGAGDDIAALDEFSQEWRGDVERQVADHLKAFPQGSSDFFEISLENILPDERNILNPLLKKVTFQDFDQPGVLFYPNHATDRISERDGQSSEAGSDFNDRCIRTESRLMDDLADHGRVAEKMLPESFPGPHGRPVF